MGIIYNVTIHALKIKSLSQSDIGVIVSLKDFEYQEAAKTNQPECLKTVKIEGRVGGELGVVNCLIPEDTEVLVFKNSASHDYGWHYYDIRVNDQEYLIETPSSNNWFAFTVPPCSPGGPNQLMLYFAGPGGSAYGFGMNYHNLEKKSARKNYIRLGW